MLCESWQKSTLNISRSAAESWGFVKNWPSDAACMINGKLVTYTELKKEKLERQKTELELKRQSYKVRKIAVYVWTFYNSTRFFFGWYTYIYGRNNEHDWAVNFRNSSDNLIEMVMKAFPLGIFPTKDWHYDWMQAFSKAYPARGNPAEAKRKDGKQKAWAWIKHNKIIKIEAV